MFQAHVMVNPHSALSLNSPKVFELCSTHTTYGIARCCVNTCGDWKVVSESSHSDMFIHAYSGLDELQQQNEVKVDLLAHALSLEFSLQLPDTSWLSSAQPGQLCYTSRLWHRFGSGSCADGAARIYCNCVWISLAWCRLKHYSDARYDSNNPW